MTIWLSEHLKNCAVAEEKNLRKHEYAGNAENSRCGESAKSAENPTLQKGQSGKKLVALNVLTDLERRTVLILSPEKGKLNVSIAENQNLSPLHISPALFVQLLAIMPTILGRITQTGRGESQQSIKNFSHQGGGKRHVHLCGPEIEELALDAAQLTNMVNKCLKFIISEAGQNSQNSDVILKTWSCCVASATNLFIQKEIKNAVSYDLKIKSTIGYTAIPWKNKPAEQCPSGPRYKALGNSMAVPVMRWIGKRITMVRQF